MKFPFGLKYMTIKYSLLMLLSMFFWGLAWPVGKMVSPVLSPFGLNTVRFAVTVVALGIWALYSKRSLHIEKTDLKFVLFGGLFSAIYSILFMTGLLVGFASAGGVLVTTFVPLLTFVITHVWLEREKVIRNREYTGLIFGLIGGFLMLGKSLTSIDKLFLTGNAYFLGCALAWSLATACGRALKNTSGFSYTYWTLLINSLVNLSFMPSGDWSKFVQADMEFFAGLFFLSILATAVGTSIYFHVTRIAGSKISSAFVLLVPFIAFVSSVLILKEPLLVSVVVGGTFSFIGVILITGVTRKSFLAAVGLKFGENKKL